MNETLKRKEEEEEEGEHRGKYNIHHIFCILMCRTVGRVCTPLPGISDELQSSFVTGLGIFRRIKRTKPKSRKKRETKKKQKRNKSMV